MLSDSIKDLHKLGLAADALNSPDGTPFIDLYKKITSAIIVLTLENKSSTK